MLVKERRERSDTGPGVWVVEVRSHSWRDEVSSRDWVCGPREVRLVSRPKVRCGGGLAVRASWIVAYEETRSLGAEKVQVQVARIEGSKLARRLAAGANIRRMSHCVV